MDKHERESLFNDAEKLYLSGNKTDAVSIYMKCLQNLEVQSSFPSLPRCLRALANHFTENGELMKSIQFVQAERLYYESALIDAASLQNKLTDMTSHGGRRHMDRVSNLTLDEAEIQKYRSKLLEYGSVIKYFVGQNKFEMALEFAKKSVKLSYRLYGSENDFTKETLCMMHDFEVEIARAKPISHRVDPLVLEDEDINHSSMESSPDIRQIDILPSLSPPSHRMSTNNRFNQKIKLTFALIKKMLKLVSLVIAFMIVAIVMLISLSHLFFFIHQVIFPLQDSNRQYVLSTITRFLNLPVKFIMNIFTKLIKTGNNPKGTFGFYLK